MKFKIFLALGIATFGIGKAYLWSHDTTLSEQVDVLKNNTMSYLEEKQDNAVKLMKEGVKEQFDKIGVKAPEKKDLVFKTEYLYEVKFKYDATGAPDWIGQKDILKMFQKASDVWEKNCGIKFTYLGNIRSDYVAVDSGTTRQDFGIVRWSQLEHNILGQAHTGSELGPVKDFIMDLNSNNFSGVKNYNSQLYSTIVHEFGHVLGLPHSRIPNSIMFYQNGVVNVELNDGDKDMCRTIVNSWDKNPDNQKIRIK